MASKLPRNVICKISLSLDDADDLKVLRLLRSQKTPLARKALLVKGVLSLYDAETSKVKSERQNFDCLVSAIDRLGDRLEGLMSNTSVVRNITPSVTAIDSSVQASLPCSESFVTTSDSTDNGLGEGSDFISGLASSFAI